MSDTVLNEMPVDSEEALAEWLCVASMCLKDAEGRLIGGKVDPDYAFQVAKMMVAAGLVTFEEQMK